MRLLFLLLLYTTCYGQVPSLLNPSFEGTTGMSWPGAENPPNFYANCCTGSLVGGCSDTHPTANNTMPASDGLAYAGSAAINSGGAVGQEGISQMLGSSLSGTYSFLIDLAIDSAPGYLQIWGGSSTCHQQELLWTSPLITNTTWSTHQVSFTPTSSHTYISFFALEQATATYIYYDHVRTGLLWHKPNRAPLWPAEEERKKRVYRYDLLGRQL